MLLMSLTGCMTYYKKGDQTFVGIVGTDVADVSAGEFHASGVNQSNTVGKVTDGVKALKVIGVSGEVLAPASAGVGKAIGGLAQ